MGVGNAFAALTEGWFGGVERRNQWDDRKRKQEREDKLDAQDAERFKWEGQQQQRDAETHGALMGEYADANRLRDQVYDDNQALRRSGQDALAATDRAMDEDTSLGAFRRSSPSPSTAMLDIGPLGTRPDTPSLKPADDVPQRQSQPLLALDKDRPSQSERAKSQSPVELVTGGDGALEAKQPVAPPLEGPVEHPPASPAQPAPQVGSAEVAPSGVALDGEQPSAEVAGVVRAQPVSAAAKKVVPAIDPAKPATQQAAATAAALQQTPGGQAIVNATVEATKGIGLRPSVAHPAKRREQVAQRYTDYWAKEGLPIVVKTLVGQGKFDEAQKAMEWTDTQAFKKGQRAYANMTYAMTIGDAEGIIEGAAQVMEAKGYFTGGYDIVRDKTSVTRDQRGDLAGAVVTLRDSDTGKEFTQRYNSMDDFITAGVMMLSPESQIEKMVEMQAAKQKPTNFRQATPAEAANYGAAAGQFGPDERFYPVNPPSGMSVETGPDGQVRVTQGAGAGAAKPFTEGQSKDVLFATRGEGALSALEPVAGSLTNRGERVAESIPLGLARGYQSDEFQLAYQAGREFLAAILRKDTGAAVTPSEEDSYGGIYLPQPGDKEAVLAAKAKARRRALEAIKAGMSPPQILAQGQALLKSDSEPLEGNVGAQVAPTEAVQDSVPIKVGSVQDGYRYKGGDLSDPAAWEEAAAPTAQTGDAASPPPDGGVEIGAVIDDHRYLGGDPADENSWEAMQ